MTGPMLGHGSNPAHRDTTPSGVITYCAEVFAYRHGLLANLNDVHWSRGRRVVEPPKFGTGRPTTNPTGMRIVKWLRSVR
jgi:hypothetical protein